MRIDKMFPRIFCEKNVSILFPTTPHQTKLHWQTEPMFIRAVHFINLINDSSEFIVI